MISPPGHIVGTDSLCWQMADPSGVGDIFNRQVRWAFDVPTGPKIVCHLESLPTVMDHAYCTRISIA